MKKAFSLAVYAFAIIGFILTAGYIAIQTGLTKTGGVVDRQHDYFQDGNNIDGFWNASEEWLALKAAIVKDTSVINRAAATAGISPRLIVSALIVEQLRLFHSDRELFKSVFSPLKILGVQSQYSWGVMGIKQDTAIQIENNLVDSDSPWFLGDSMIHALDYPATTTDKDADRFARLTDEHDRYYSYLYAAIAIKQSISQWNKAGIDISNRPEILATLFNIGFQNSHPHVDPRSGGAAIEIGGTTYSFGDLAGRFYYSNELLAEFPRMK